MVTIGIRGSANMIRLLVSTRCAANFRCLLTFLDAKVSGVDMLNFELKYPLGSRC